MRTRQVSSFVRAPPTQALHVSRNTDSFTTSIVRAASVLLIIAADVFEVDAPSDFGVTTRVHIHQHNDLGRPHRPHWHPRRSTACHRVCACSLAVTPWCCAACGADATSSALPHV